MADDLAAASDLQAHPFACHAVTVIHCHAGVAFGEVLDLYARFLAVIQFLGQFGKKLLGKHLSDSLRYCVASGP